jgi:hypothetical protein
MVQTTGSYFVPYTQGTTQILKYEFFKKYEGIRIRYCPVLPMRENAPPTPYEHNSTHSTKVIRACYL